MQSDHYEKCLARTRKGLPCQTIKVLGKKRCRMHGGAIGSGAPLNNKNAYKHGKYNAEAIITRREIRTLLRGTAELLRELKNR